MLLELKDKFLNVIVLLLELSWRIVIPCGKFEVLGFIYFPIKIILIWEIKNKILLILSNIWLFLKINVDQFFF